MISCDTCGKECSQFDIQELKSCYQTRDIKQVCPACLKKINSHFEKLNQLLSKMRDEVGKSKISWLQSFMEKLRSKDNER